MDDVQRCHEALLQQRTQIRHDPAVHRWMKRCWQCAEHAEPNALTQDEYEDMYSILLYEMTICWEEELNDAILSKIWKRDAANYTTLNFERFGCSLFSFVEMWVEEITLVEYEKIFSHIYRTLSRHDQHRSVNSPSFPETRYRTFKPTLESFNNALDNEKAMEELQMNVGKSISFDAQQYYRHFGTLTTHLQAFQATLLHLQSRVNMEPTDQRPTSPGKASTATSPGQMLRRQLREARKTSTIDPRPPSPQRQASSPPRLMRPVMSSGRSSFVLAVEGSSSQTSPERIRSSGEAFVLTGKSVLHTNTRQLPNAIYSRR